MRLVWPVGSALFRWIAVLVALGTLVAASGVTYVAVRRSEIAVLPRPTGPYGIGRVSYDWVDDAREDPLAEVPGARRELLVWVWYPAAPADTAPSAEYLPPEWRWAREEDQGPGRLLFQRLDTIRVHAVAGAPPSTARSPYPVLLLLPGMGNYAPTYTTLAEELASHGYVVFGVTPTYSASAVAFPDGRVARQTRAGSIPEDGGPAEVKLAGDRLVEIWAADARFVLDRLSGLDAEPGGGFAGRLDLARVGIVGHSFGGAAAAETCRLDVRCRAGVDLDGRPFGGVVGLGLDRPFMLVSSERADPCEPACEEAERDWASLYTRLRGGGYNLTIGGARHFNFTDYAVLFAPPLGPMGMLGPIDGQRGLRIAAAYVLAFFDRYLNGAPEPLLQGPSPEYPEVQFTAR